jgi:hypothetical protein
MQTPKFYPALYLYAVNTALGVVVAFGFLNQTTSAAVTTIGTAVLGLIVAFFTRPFIVGAAAAAFSSVLVGLGGFGLHLADVKIGALVTLFSMIAGFLTHQNVVPQAGSPAIAPVQPVP